MTGRGRKKPGRSHSPPPAPPAAAARRGGRGRGRATLQQTTPKGPGAAARIPPHVQHHPPQPQSVATPPEQFEDCAEGLQPGEGLVGRAEDAGHPPDPGEARTTPVRQKWTGPAHHRPPRAPVLSHPLEPAGLQPGEGSVDRVVDTGHPPDYREGRTTPVRQGWTGHANHRPPRAPVLSHSHEPAELNKIQHTRHKVRRQSINVELVDSQSPLHVTLPPKTLDSIQETDTQDSILVSGVPESVSESHLQMYFETPKYGGCEEGVVKCEILSPGRAGITFRDSKVAAKVMSETHSVKGSLLRLQYAAEEFELNKLLLHISPKMDQEFLQLYLERTLQMDNTNDFSVEATNLIAVVTFTQDYSKKELSSMAETLNAKPPKGIAIQAELFRVSSSDGASGSPATTKDNHEKYPGSQGTEEGVLSADDFEKRDKLGGGTGGVVFQGVWMTNKALPVAMKKLFHVDDVQGLDICREVTFLRKLRHPNIIRYYGTFKLVDSYYIVTELAEKGSLWYFLQNHPDPDLQQSFRWAKEIARGVKYLHQYKCIHRDLKSGNVLLMVNLTAKICDFGSAKQVRTENVGCTVQTSPTGTYQWRPPEAILGRKNCSSSSWDVYSYGLLLWELMTHKIPFSHLNLRIPGQEFQLQMKISNGERPPIPDSCDPKLASVMRRCWSEEPGSRPTFTQVLADLEGGPNDGRSPYEEKGTTTPVRQEETGSFYRPPRAQVLPAYYEPAEMSNTQWTNSKPFVPMSPPPEVIEEADTRDSVLVSGVPESVSEGHLEMYFQTPRSGGCDEGVVECRTLSPGRACITFRDPKVAAKVMAGTHSLKGSLLRLQYADEDFELNKLLLRFSPKMDWELVQLYLERTLQRQDFSIEATDSSAVVTFNQGHSKKDLSDLAKRINAKPPKDISVHAELYQILSSHHDDNGDSDTEITLQLSALKTKTTKDELERYFKRQGAAVNVLSAVMLGNGKATVTLSGVSEEELHKMKTMRHKINKQNVTVHMEVCASPASTKQSQTSTTNQPRTIIVSGVPADTDEDLLQLYFQGRKSGGCNDCVEECSLISSGKARVTFCDPKVLANVMSKSSHFLSQSQLKLRIADESGSEEFELDKLLLRKVPAELRKEFLDLFCENKLDMIQPDDFTLTVKGTSAVIQFAKEYSMKVLSDMATSLRAVPRKGTASFEVELCQITHTVRVSGITKNYEESYLKLYFENQKRSGGGEVASVELLGCGEAVVTFREFKVIPRVLEKAHTAVFGDCVSVTRPEPSELSLVATGDGPSVLPKPCIITVDPLIAESLHKNPEGIQRSVASLHVDIHIDSSAGRVEAAPTKRTKAKWEEECQETLSQYIQSKYTKKETQVQEDALIEITALIDKQSQLATTMTSNNTLLQVAGEVEGVNELIGKVEAICSSYTQVEEVVQLNPRRYHYITELKLPHIKSTHSGVMIQENDLNFTVLVKGSARNVALMQESLKCYLDPAAVLAQLDPPVVQYLQTENGKKQLTRFIKKHHLQAVIHFEHTFQSQVCLVFLCDPDKEVDTKKCAKILQEETQAQATPLPQSFVRQFPLKDYDELCMALEQKYNVQIITSDKELSIAGFANGVHPSSKALQSYVHEKSTTESRLEIGSGILRLLSGAMTDKWKGLIARVQHGGVQVILPDAKAPKPQVVLAGDIVLVQEGCDAISVLLKSIWKRTLPLERPGSCQFFREQELLVRGIENKHEVVIETREIDSFPGEDNGETFTHFPKICVAQTSRLEIALYIGDITDFNRADVIVNAANANLQHSGGVAKAIADKGGPIIQQESTRHIRSAGPLQDGDVWVSTKVGQLPYRAIIHAVGPKWKGGRANEEAVLLKACIRSLQQAALKGYHSIAFPAIGSGIYGFPIDRCADTLIRAAIEFSDKNPGTALREVNIILYSLADSTSFVAAVKKNIPSATVFESFAAVATTTAPGGLLQKPTPSHSIAAKKIHVVARDTQTAIKLHKGSILDVEADVFVNTTNGDLDLSQGAVAVALAKAAGPDLQSECKTKAPVAVGDLAITGAGGLSCRYVFHTVAPAYDKPGGEAEKALKGIVQKCMKECIRLKATSIAFPALGAGNLNFPNEVVARIMVDEISTFLSVHKNTPLKVVHLVIFMKATHAVFETKLASDPIEEVLVDDEIKPLHPGLSPRATARHKTGGSSYLSALGPSTKLSGGTAGEAAFGDIKVQVIQGDITEETSDVVVNTTNPSMQLQGAGVSGALFRKGGHELQKECDKVTSKKGPLKEGKVVVTPTRGKLKSKALFHIVFQSKDPQSFVKLIISCLKKAEKLHYQSISFPAVGTGSNGYPPEEAAQGVFEAIRQFSRSKHTHLRCVRLVLFQPQIYQAFVTEIHDTDGSDSSSPGFFSRMGGYFGSLLPTWPSTSISSDDDASDEGSEHADYEIVNKELEVKIYGATEASVKKAEETLYKTIEDHLITETMNISNLDDLSQSEINELHSISRQMQVEMEINPDPLNYIRVRGGRADVAQVKVAVTQTLAKFEKHASKVRESKTLYQTVRWKRQGSQEDWVDYDPLPNLEIEQAFQRKSPRYTYNGKSESYEIDFKKEEEFDCTTKATCKVKRVDLLKEGHSRPHYWDPIPKDPKTQRELPIHVVDLRPDSKEYKGVVTEFHKTVVQGQSYSNVISIQRIQAPALYGQYAGRKKNMDDQNPKDHPNERQLFHGTSVDTIPKINLQGFNRSFSGKHATVYGCGTYFARNASYSTSNTYSKPDTIGQKYIYFARVLTGVFTRGDSSMIIPPARDPQKDPHFLFDSVVDHPSNPSIFVVFGDAQAYPEYLITFK